MRLYKFGRFIISLAASIIIFGCQQHSTLTEDRKQKEELNNSGSSAVPAVNQNLSDLEKITYLKNIGEIKDGFCEEEYNFFVKITSLCLDTDNNLYVADSGQHRIFKFDYQGKYISSFGSQGQGPGEFLGILRMSFGNDGRLYITDDGNNRLSIFSFQGKFIHQFLIPRFLYDTAITNSRGEIYLLSQSGLKIIDFFDSDMKFKESFLEMNYQLNFPYQHPPKALLKRMMIRPTRFEVKKLITKDDHLFAVFNNTQLVFYLGKNNKIIKQFKIKHQRFVKDYKARLKKAITEGAWINCFGSVFFDDKENLCLCYFNATYNLPEIYRYRKDGTFTDTLRVKYTQDKTNSLVSTCDNRGNYYSINMDSTKIIIYGVIN